jgi:hypothetical protein
MVPDCCMAGMPGERCRLKLDHYRERKTGPGFQLTVVRCTTHKKALTLYPPGHYPYGRVAVAPAAPDGALLLKADQVSAEGNDVEGGKSVSRVDWSMTVFEAAQDAAQAEAWPRESPSRWRTQGRWLQLGARLLGIGPAVYDTNTDRGQRHRERMAGTLGLRTMHVLEGAQRYKDSRGYCDRGQTVMHVLHQLPMPRTLSERILAAGAIAGLWGQPSRWDPRLRVVRPLLFC